MGKQYQAGMLELKIASESHHTIAQINKEHSAPATTSKSDTSATIPTPPSQHSHLNPNIMEDPDSEEDVEMVESELITDTELDAHDSDS